MMQKKEELSLLGRASASVERQFLKMMNSVGCRPLTAHILRYAASNIFAQMRAVLPLFFFMLLLRAVILQQAIEDVATILPGLVAVIFGLFLFLEGLKHGMMPMGATLGEFLPQKYSISVVLVVSFILGVLVTYAEPAVSALLPLGSLVQVEVTPYLYALLHDGKEFLVLSIGLGVGVAATVGILSFTRKWSLKPIILVPLIPSLLLASYMQWVKPELAATMGLVWDCGAVTTGPVTVPIILALGIGTTKNKSGGDGTDSSLGGLGLVTLASLFPVWVVQMFVVILSWIWSEESIKKHADKTHGDSDSILDKSPVTELYYGIRAVVPLVAFLLLTLKFLVKESVPSVPIRTIVGAHTEIIDVDTNKSSLSIYPSNISHYHESDHDGHDHDDDHDGNPHDSRRRRWINSKAVFVTALGFSQIGIIIFFLGITYGLKMIGSQVGNSLPTLFMDTTDDPGSPHIKPYNFGLAVLLFMVWLLGMLVTLAEPALQVMGEQVEVLTNGSFKKMMLVWTVAVGVGLGMVLGVLRIIYDWKLVIFIWIGYGIAYFITLFSDEAFVRIAWDSAGVTTGPVTVPFVLALGLSFGRATNAKEGFGILTCASFCPILCVLTLGVSLKLWNWMRGNKQKSSTEERQKLIP